MTTPMRRFSFRYLTTPLLFSALLVVPFAVLEWVNRRDFREGFPFVLFTFMSVNALLIALSMTPALGRLGSDRRLGALTRAQWAGLACSVLLVVVYANVIADQLPCFLGVPNCD